MKMFSRFPAITEIFCGSRGRNFFLFLLTLIPNALAALLEGLSFAFILLALESLTPSQGSTLASLSQFLAKWLPPLSPTRSFTLFLLTAVILQILRSSCAYLGQIGATYLGTEIQSKAQQKVYRQILSFTFPCVHRYNTGDLLEYAKGAATFPTIILDSFNKIVVTVLGIGASLIVMVLLSPPLTAVALTVFIVLGLSQKFIIKNISTVSRILSDHTVDFSKHTMQSLQGLRVIHTFHRQEKVMEKISHILEKISDSTRKLNLWNHSILPINETMGILLVGIFLITGQYLIKDNGMAALPILLTFMTIAYRLNTRMQTLLALIGGVAVYWGQVLRLEDILSPQGKEFTVCQGKPFANFEKTISFRNLTLQYPFTQEPSILNLDLEITKGTTIALVGSSGAGKSSIVDLLLRLYQPTHGHIQIDGESIDNYEVGSWRDKLGVVSQDIFIFNQTIEENIRFGSLDAPIEKVIHAARLAGAHAFIEALPEKYRTVVGEKGYRLSGGEKQRIALARALVRDPEILVLDEATSSLDSQSEMLIQQAIENLQGKKTILIVAHRLSTIQNADKIFVLEGGRLVEAGSHAELLQKQGRYALFWEIQSKR